MQLIHDRGNFGYGYGGWGIADDLLWAFLLLGLIALVVVLIVRLLRNPNNGNKAASPTAPDKALEIARERFAKGELSPNEFETIKKALSG